MKKIVFLANDPGGYDVIIPVCNAFYDTADYQTELLLSGKAAEKANRTPNVLKEIFASLDGACVLVTGTSWGSEIETKAIRYSKERNIRTIAILDYWSNYKERFKLNVSYEFPDYYLVMDELAMSEAIKDGVDSSIVKIVGTPGLDKYINNKVILQERGRVVFLSQPLSTLYGNDLGYTELSAFEQVIEAAGEVGLDVSIKFHPKDGEDFINRYNNYSVSGSMEWLCERYEYIIGMSSMALLQCALMGGNVISFQPGLKTDDMSIVNKLGITNGAFSYSDLIDRLDTKTLAFINKKNVFWLDGKSTERCVNKIIQIALGMK